MFLGRPRPSESQNWTRHSNYIRGPGTGVFKGLKSRIAHPGCWRHIEADSSSQCKNCVSYAFVSRASTPRALESQACHGDAETAKDAPAADEAFQAAGMLSEVDACWMVPPIITTQPRPLDDSLTKPLNSTKHESGP